jgi:hypothetical protein
MRLRSARAPLCVLLGLAALAYFGAGVVLRFSKPVLLDFGPNDAEYVNDFRIDWERDGRTRFHWTSVAARVELPLLLSGPGHVLRLRARRHFIEPAQVTLTSEGQRIGRFEIASDPDVPYRIHEFPLPALAGRRAFMLEIEAPSANPRPLGIALDWLEIERAGAQARVALPEDARLRLVLLAWGLLLCPWWAGWPLRRAAPFAVVLTLAALLGLMFQPLAAERILRLGLGSLVGVGVLSAAALRIPFLRRAVRIDEPATSGLLTALVLFALAVRLVLLLHPQFYYPDVRIHAVFARELAKAGLSAFLENFTANQYRFSLGLQFEHGHWYAFPYPPAFYLLCWPLLRLARLSPEVAVSTLAAVVNALETILIYALARRLTRSAAWAQAAAACSPLLPIFMIRLGLAYFPALVGHAVDALVLLLLVRRLRRLDRPASVLILAAAVAAALLTYTQSLLNWGLWLPLLLVARIVQDRSRAAWRQHAGLALAGMLGALLSLAFYGRYVPIFLDMQRGIPMAEEAIVLEKMAKTKPIPGEKRDEAPDDPFAGPTFDPLRGLQKAAWRLWVFYGPFAPLLLVGLVLVMRHAPGPEERTLILTWASMYVVLNLASGGLPGPNLVRYNKDLEVVAPLCCLALAGLYVRLRERSRPLAWLLAAAFLAYGSGRAFVALTEKFFIQR